MLCGALPSAPPYPKSCFTFAEIAAPSAFPASCFEATPITFPISFMPVAPTYSMMAFTAAVSSSSESCFGRYASRTVISASSLSARSGRFCWV